MSSLDFSTCEAEILKSPLVPHPTSEYPNGFGMHLSFPEGRDLRRAIKKEVGSFSELARQHGVVLCTVREARFRARRVFSDLKLPSHQPRPFPNRSLPFHVDLRRGGPSVGQLQVFWSNGTYVFWQNATDAGRYASTFFTPTSVVADEIEKRYPHSFESESPLQKVMDMRDFFISVLLRKTDPNRVELANEFELLHQSIFDAVRDRSVVVDWSDPCFSRGLVCFSDAGSAEAIERPLVHARDNRGFPLNRSTVHQAVLP